jgi:hypothetical protein
MQNAVRSACRGRNDTMYKRRGGEEHLARKRRCVAGMPAVLRWRLVASLACTSPGRKKKETIPAEEKESSRLELLV